LTDIQPLLQRIGSVSFDRYIDIQGHTDDTGSNVLNWRLSSERALSMLQFMEQYELSNAGIRLIAYADTQPLISIDGLTEDRLAAARKANRRISLLIHRRMME
jgi:flagellar motor protein MotB